MADSTLGIFAAMASAIDVSIPLPAASAAYAPTRDGDCPRCDGTRVARRDADGRAVPAHRCPVCRRRHA